MHPLKIVYSNFRYVVLSLVIFVLMLFGLLLISEYLFLEPYVIGHIPIGTEFGLILIIILSILSALVIPLNIYRISIFKGSKKKIGGGLFGSFIGSVAGACSCGPIGFAIISTFGSIGATASSFLTNFEIPIRIIAIGLLCVTFYTTTRSLNLECKLDSI